MIDNYLLGLFATDGSLREKYYQKTKKIYYSIVLEMKDDDIIKQVTERLNLQMKFRKRIINNKKRIFYKVYIGQEIATKYSLYLKNHKEKIFNYFKKLNDEEQNKFMRGAFDGDGGVCKYKNGGLRSYLCANSIDNLDKVYEYWFNKNNIKYSKYCDKRGKGAYNYNIGAKKQVELFASLIYQTKDIKLNRKFDIFVQNGFLSTEM